MTQQKIGPTAILGIATPNHGTMLREFDSLKGITMKSPIIKRSVIVRGHKTSITLEDPFWTCLKEIAEAQGATIAQTVTGIDDTRQHNNLSSAIRLFVLGQVRNEKKNGSVAVGT